MKKILNIYGESGSGKTYFVKEAIANKALINWFNTFFDCRYKAKDLSVSLLPLPKLNGSIKECLLFYNEIFYKDILSQTKKSLNRLLRSIIQNNNYELGINTSLLRDIETLSAGELRRFYILKALLRPDDLIVIDEPFSNSDMAHISTIISAIGDASMLIIISHMPIKGSFDNTHEVINLNIKEAIQDIKRKDLMECSLMLLKNNKGQI
jgi:ABC-type Mn2+/Zn2+ transport system ATPase subunit